LCHAPEEVKIFLHIGANENACIWVLSLVIWASHRHLPKAPQMGFGDLIKKLSAQELLKPCHQIARPIKLSGATAPASNQGAQIEGADNSRHIGTAICGDSGSELLGSVPPTPTISLTISTRAHPFLSHKSCYRPHLFPAQILLSPDECIFKACLLNIFAIVLLGFHVALVRTFYVSFNRIPQWKE
jgi:hypothetical protein